jgi:large subunit ribosomal protein L10
MPKTRLEKERKVAELVETLGEAKAIYLADLSGMSVEMLTGFRRLCRENGITLEVVKNTLLHRASRDTQFAPVSPHLHGPTALMTTTTDAVAPARILDQYTKKNKMPKVKVAWLEGDLFDEVGIQSLAKLPSREVLLSMLLSVLNAPLTNLVGVLSACPRNLANVLDQVAKQRDGGGQPVAVAEPDADAAPTASAATEVGTQ